jgi:hypothetical protein
MSAQLPIFTKDTMTQVASLMGIACEPWMQDWPLEVADGTRLEEFLNCYEIEERPDRCEVMAEVLLVSLDEAFQQGKPAAEILARSARILRKHPELLDYWRCPAAASEDEMFAITKWLRDL